jgi:predicted GNAT superfamily acetyltransferase
MRDVDFVNNVTIALSNEEMIKIKVVDHEKLYNLVVENFFI